MESLGYLGDLFVGAGECHADVVVGFGSVEVAGGYEDAALGEPV